jgi:nitroreductase
LLHPAFDHEFVTETKLPSGPLSTLAAINTRCSVRHYSSDKLDRATVQALLDAAVRAPTAIHEEPWAFVVIQDTLLLRQISDIAKAKFVEEDYHGLDRGGHALDMFQQPEFNIFYDASTLIIICGTAVGRFVVADCWLAAENLMLAACALGLGTCVIGSAVDGLNTPELKATLDIPEDMTAIAPIIVGVPAGTTAASPRKPAQVLAWK